MTENHNLTYAHTPFFCFLMKKNFVKFFSLFNNCAFFADQTLFREAKKLSFLLQKSKTLLPFLGLFLISFLEIILHTTPNYLPVKKKLLLKEFHFVAFKKDSNKNGFTNYPLLESKPFLALLSLLFMVFLSLDGNAQTTSTFTTSGTWICPQGVTTIQVEAWGAGGAGGNGGASNKNAGGGGGGGGYSKLIEVPVTAGTTYTISVGTGGTPNGFVGENGGNGGVSTATFGATTVTASGGNGGFGYTNSSTGGTRGAGSSFNGGKGANGNNTKGIGGGGGEGAGTTAIGGNASGCTGGSGTDGGNGATYAPCGGGNSGSGVTATTATGYGGGGSGSVKNYVAGAGAAGAIKITYTCPSNTIANAGSNQTLTACSTTTTLAGNTPTYGTGTWTQVSGTVATITSPNSPTSSVTGLTLGATSTFRWTISNGSCGSTTSDVIINTSTGPGCLNYCTPTGNLNCTVNDYISNVTLNTLNNTTTCGAGGYTNYAATGAQTTALLKGSSYTFGLSVGVGTGTHGAGVWIDFNQNGSFADAGEFFLVSNAIAASSTTSISIPIPMGALAGNVRMRVRYAYNITVGSGMSCTMAGTYGETEDYTITLTDPLPCVAPTAQPTALVLTPAGNTITGNFTAASPAADNYLVVISTSATPPSPANGTTYTIGSAVLGGTNVIVDTDSNTTFTATGLAALTTYYVYVFSFNTLCTGGPLYYTTSPLNGSTTTLSPTYCSSTGTTAADGITGVIFNTINNTGTAVNVAYSNYTAITTTVTKGNSYNLRAYVNTGGDFTNYQSAWIDWNGNGLFTDPGEFYNLGSAKNVTDGISSLCPYPISVPLGAITGAVRMRIQSKYNTPTTGSCETGFDGEVEDYTINIISDPAACTTPTAQASSLILSPNGTSVSGSFTAASPVPNRYLVIISTSAVAPAPANGTVYTVGGTVGAGYTVVDTDSNTTFLANGLTPNTNYHVYVFAFNGICTGGPLYNTTAPLNGTTTTLTNIYCTPSSVRSSDYISGIASVGTLNDISNAPTGYSPNGYANYTGITIASQIPAGGINIDIYLTGSQFVRAYVDWNNDGDFIDAGEEVYSTGLTATGDTSFGFIVPGAQAPGNYRMRIRTKSFNENNAIDPCTTGYLTGETEDYTINIQADCLQKITSWTDGEACGPTNTVNLTAVSAGATGFRWYATETGGTPIQDVTGSGNWTTPSIGTTKIYYVTAYNGTCESLYRVPVVATIKTTTNIMVTPSVPSVCGEGNVVEIYANGDVVVEDLLVQNFESGLGSFTITTPTNTLGGADSPWSIKTSPYQPITTSVWKPAINSSAAATIGNKFAFTTSDYTNSIIETRLTTPVINASIYTSLTLTFDHYYSYYGGDSGSIEVSIDGGTTWITPASAVYNSDLGSASKFKSETVDFSAYAGQSNLQFRFTYKGSWDDGWAIDNINLSGTRPLNTTFSWSGGVAAFTDAACTVPYVSQLVSTIYVKPTGTQINAATWSFTAMTTLGNGCPVSKFITITNNTKTWQGTSSDWNDANNWMPAGVPDSNTCVIVPSAVNASILSIGATGNGKNLIVKSGGTLELQSGNSLTIKESVNVNAGGTFNIENNGSLVQIDDVANTGNISMKRDANIRKLDYVYWSSPVANFASSDISSGTSTGYIYKWLPTTATGLASNFGNWSGGNETMTTGKGYIVRGPNNFTTTPQIFTANFTGVPNNGNITTPIARSTYDGAPYVGPTTTLVTKDDDNWNLIGNPYPSAIDALSFLTANTNIAGFIKIWSHGTLPSSATADPFYQDYGYNYTTADYITYNNLGSSTSPLFTGKIGAGQGFFVLMNHSSVASNENVLFDNTMRNEAYSNDQFFRTSVAASTSAIERNRIWLDLIAPDAKTNRTLVGYATGATNLLDRIFDADAIGVKTNFELYSLAENTALCIQGRSLPFDQNDTVPMGISIAQNGIHTIAIASVDGLFSNSNQNIFLEDQLLGIIHNLRMAPYTFAANAGTFENRFVLRYTSSALGTLDIDLSSNTVTVVANEKVSVRSSGQFIKEIIVFDLLGRKIDSYINVNAKNFTLNHLSKTMTTLIVKVILENDSVVTEKVIF